ncbi:hypothetical protein NIES3974_48220 [Calothrix sp. NIES-3974]|nr:hypothetical protein NIES3974_48220 [Calothrix sp. NIES-3974]
MWLNSSMIMYLSSARQYFYQEVQQPDEQIDLAKAALYIAQEEYPHLDPQEYINALDTMADELQERLPSQSYPLLIIKTINQYLYDDLGFTGNTKNYYDPENSFLNQVIDRRTGIPITLALVYIEIARRINFPMSGVGMPGHFLIRPNFPEMEIFIDAFNRGEILFPQDCQDKLNQIFNHQVQLQPEFLATVNNRNFLARILMNLKSIYIHQETPNHLEKALAVVERLLLLFPQAILEIRDRGLLYYRLGQFHLAAKDLETYLNQVPNAQDTITIHHILDQIRQK